MFKLFIGRALMCLPFAMLCWMLCFFLAWRSLQQKNRIVQVVVRMGFLLCFAILTTGMVYGVLRFSGTIMFTTDNGISYNWFDASWRDDGFKYIYGCGTVLAGFVTAILFEAKNVKKQDESLKHD